MKNFDFHSVFRADFATGQLFWIAPPNNHAQRVGWEAGCVNVGVGKNKTYWQVRVFGRTFKRSRVIFHMANGHWPQPCVDHINGNSLDDRPDNLRECTLSQNAANSADKKRTYDLPRGVYRTRQGKFMARVTESGVTRNLGVFDTPEDAACVYMAAKKEIFHDFA